MKSKKHIHNLSTLASICCVVAFMGSCKNNAPDVSHIKIELNAQRLDKDLHALNINSLGAELQALHVKYPEFLGFYLDTIMGFGINGNYADTNVGIQKGLYSFLTHKDYRGVFDSVNAHYPDESKINGMLIKGFQNMKHYFPDYQTPNIIYLVTGLNNYGALTYGDNTIGIGLDMFLGANYPFYKAVGIPDYFSRQLNEKYLPVAVFRTVYRQTNPFSADGRVLLDMMIQSGKEMYFISKVLPFLDEHVRLAYSPEQLKWCEENEGMIFNFFASKELLYESNLQKVVRYVMDGPSAAGMPDQSPGNIGAWLGLQIVEAYMAKNPKMTLPELIQTPIDAQMFLSQSKYKPK